MSLGHGAGDGLIAPAFGTLLRRCCKGDHAPTLPVGASSVDIANIPPAGQGHGLRGGGRVLVGSPLAAAGPVSRKEKRRCPKKQKKEVHTEFKFRKGHHGRNFFRHHERLFRGLAWF